MNSGLRPERLLVGALCLVMLFLQACTPSRYSMRHDAAPQGEFDFSNVPDATPKWEPLSPQGNASPYKVNGKWYSIMPSANGYQEEGVASWYGLKFHGELTSNGETYNMYEMSAAHKTLPLPTYLRVTNLENGRTVVVRVNDRGPFHSERIIDLSFAAASRLGFADNGTARVKLEAVSPPAPSKSKPGDQPARQKASSNTVDVPTKVVKQDRLAPFVQVAAFGQASAARSMEKRLREGLGLQNVFVAESEKNGRPIFRVRVGPFDNEAQAVALRKRIEQANVGEPIVITRSVLANER